MKRKKTDFEILICFNSYLHLLNKSLFEKDNLKWLVFCYNFSQMPLV